MATLDEEIKRRQIVEALSHLDTQSEADFPKPDKTDVSDYGDWRKWPSIDPDKVPAGHIDLKPPETPLTIPTPTPESPAGPTNVLTDPESGTPYVLDTGEKIPRAELATPAEKQAFTPADVTLPSETVTRTPRAMLVDPDPDAQYMTPDEVKRATLVQFPKGEPATMPWRLSAPGFVEGSQNAILNPAAGVVPPVRRGELVTKYPTIAEDQGAPGTPPKVERAQPIATPTPTPTPTQPTVAQPAAESHPITTGQHPDSYENLQPDFSDRIKAWQADMQAHGYNPQLYETGRDPAYQKELYQKFLAGKGTQAVPSGHSYHEFGRAIDWVNLDKDGNKISPDQNKDIYRFGAQLAKKYGLTGIGESDIDHIEDAHYKHYTDLPKGDYGRINVAPAAVQPTVPTGPKAQGTHVELAPPGQMDLRPTEPQAAKSVVPSPSAQPAVKPVADDWKTWTTVDGTPAGGAVAEKPAETYEGPPAMNAPNGLAPSALIIHHTSGRNSAESVVDDWRTHRPGVGAQMIMDRDGVIHETAKEFGYNGTGNFLHSVIPGVSNQTAVGIEVIARDDADMTPAQLDSLKRLAGPKGPYANVPVYGHSQVSPGDRDNEGVRGVAAINEARAGGTDSSQVLSQLSASGLNTTHYGYDGDPDLDADSAAHHGKYVDQMIGGFDVALNAAAARLVGNPKPGEEFQYAGKLWRYGDKVPEKYADARFDIFDPTNTALSGGRLGGETTVAAPKKQDWESWATLSPAEATAAQQTKQITDATALNDGLNQSGNLISYYKTMAANPPKGVDPAVVKSFQANLQKTITEEMQKRFPDMTPEVAWKKAQEDSSLWDIGAEFLHQGQASFAQLAPVFAQRSADKEQLNAFFDNVLPRGSDADKQALLAQIHALPREQQGPFIASKIPLPQAGQRGSDPMAVLSAIDHLSDPEFQKKEADKLAVARAVAEKAASEDPRLRGSAGEAVAQTGAAAEQILAYYGIPIIGAAQAAEETRRAMAKEHPDWDEAKLDSESAYSSLAKVYGNTIAAHVMGSGAGLLLKSLTTPWKRAVGQVLAGTLTNMGISGGTTIATNITEGKSAMRGVGESTLTGAVQGALFGGLHGTHELMAPRPEVPLTVGPHGPPAPRSQPVTREGVFGPDVLDTSVPWYRPGPIVTRAAERTTFTPEELVAAAKTLPSGATPEQVQRAAENLTPPSSTTQQDVFFRQPEIPSEAAPPPGPTREDVARRTYELGQEREKTGQPGTGVNDWARAQAELSHAQEPTPATQGESEPWVSAIANRFVAERAARGELGEVIPGEGYSQGTLRAIGLKMGPEEINQHISDLMHNTGNPKLQAAAVTAREAELSQRSHAASRASEAAPGNAQLSAEANVAFHDLTDFHNNAVAKLKSNWHAQGMTLQGEVPMDLSTFNGLKERFLRENGEAPSKNMEPQLRKIAKAVAESSTADKAAMHKLGKEIERQSARRRLPTAEEVRNMIMETVKDYPCRT